MKEQETTERTETAGEGESRHGLGLIAWFTALLVVLYVLSPPAVYKFILKNQSGPPPRIVQIVYMPLTVLVTHVTWVDNFYRWYYASVWNVKVAH